jgi:tetratricopeptide (TPR) repeat protein
MVRHGLVVFLALASAGIASAGRDPVAVEPCLPSQDLQASLARTTEGLHAYDARDLQLAVAKLGLAIELHPANHTAWYYLGHALSGLKQHGDAASAFEQAVALSGEDAMYHLWHGISLYKAALAEARARPDATGIDVNALKLGAELDPAADALEAATRHNPGLFRAHYYLGRIHRHQGDAAAAAAAFAAAITHNPRDVDPYIALGELYRRWDYTTEAIQVLHQGALTAVGQPADLAELHFALGRARDDRRDHAYAIAAYTESLDLDASLHKARYQRGLAYFELKDDTHAKEDLERFLEDGGEQSPVVSARARLTLKQIARRSRR